MLHANLREAFFPVLSVRAIVVPSLRTRSALSISRGKAKECAQKRNQQGPTKDKKEKQTA
jgi:hypothetical protein